MNLLRLDIESLLHGRHRVSPLLKFYNFSRNFHDRYLYIPGPVDTLRKFSTVLRSRYLVCIFTYQLNCCRSVDSRPHSVHSCYGHRRPGSLEYRTIPEHWHCSRTLSDCYMALQHIRNQLMTDKYTHAMHICHTDFNRPYTNMQQSRPF